MLETEYISWLDHSNSIAKNMLVLEYFYMFGSELFIGTVSILLILWLALKERNFTGIILTVLAVGGGNFINTYSKSTVERETGRLAWGRGFNFRSGHAMVGLIFLLVLAFFISKHLTSSYGRLTVYVAAIVIALLTGLSRLPEKHSFLLAF
jgi:undecaprenyl-diphosphatase